MGGGKSQTSTSSTTIPPEVLARYNSVNSQAQSAAATPFQQYSTDPNAFVAPLNSTQNAGIANTNAATNQAQPYYQGATAATLAGSQQANLGGLNTNQYLSPYLNQVVGNTEAQLQNQNQQQSSALQGNAIQAGAFGGDRAGIAQGNLANQQSLANAQTISGLENTGYQQAQSVAQQQQGATLSAQQANLAREQAGGAQLANIGNQAQTSALQGASAQLTAGQTAQQTQQAGQTALYNQFLQQQSYPFQVDQFLANIAEGTGALSGSTTSTTSPSSFFSDKRLKEDIKPIGKTFDGQPIYRYRYKDQPGVQMGLIAQDVEKKHPHAVGLAAGYRTVDYDKATDDAAKRGHFRTGGLVPEYADGGSAGIDTTDENPYGGASYFNVQPLVLRHLMTAQPVGGQKTPQNAISQASGLFNDAKSLYGDGSTIYNGIQSLKTGGRAGYAGGGGPYDTLVGAPPSNENTPDYSLMVSAPPIIVPTGAQTGPTAKPGTTSGTTQNGTSGAAAPVSTGPSVSAGAMGGMDTATHGGMNGTENMRSGGRIGYDDGGGLPYQDDSQDSQGDVDTPQYLKQKTGLDPSGISIPNQQNTHGLMTAQNPTGAATSGLGGVTQAANLAKNIYGLGSGIAGLVAPAATAAAPAAAAGLAGTAAAGTTAAATGGGGILSGLLGLLPFLSTGGSVDRKHFDDGGDVGDAPLDPNNPMSPFAHIGDPNYQQPGEAGAGKPVVVVPAAPADVVATPASDATAVAPSRTPEAIAADVMSAYGKPQTMDGLEKNALGFLQRTPTGLAGSTSAAASAPTVDPSNDNSATGLVPDLPPAQYIAPQKVRPIKAEMAAPSRGLVPSSAPDTVPANAPLPPNVTPQDAQTAQGPSGGGGSIKEAVLAHIGAGEAKSYNELVGGGNFDGYSQFPKWSGVQGPAGISHAAGLYQFQPGTWNAEAQKLGLPDFSPASQDAAAWDLAQNTYKQNTGRDLSTDAQNGSVKWSALGSQWSSLQGAKSGPMGSASLPGSGQPQEHPGNGLDATGSIGGGGSQPSGGLMGGVGSTLGNAASWLDTSSPSRNLLLSALSGIGKMASSNSRYLGAAALQGLGGGADTYAALQKQAADIGQTQANTVRTQQESNLTAAHTAQTQQQTTNLHGAQYRRIVIPNDGTYVQDTANPYSGLTKVTDAQGNPISGVSPELQNAAKNAPLGTSTATGSGTAQAPAATPAQGASAPPQQATGPQDLRPASINPTVWKESSAPPANYQPGVQARYANYASDPAGGAQIRQQAIQEAAKLHDAASAAAQTQQSIAQMRDAYQNMPANAQGPIHDAYMKVGGELNAYTNAVGLGNVIDPQGFASGQEVDKLHSALASTMGGTKGAQLFADVASSVPGGSNTPLGFARVAASVNQMAQRTRTLSAYMDNYATQFGTLNGAQEAFDAQNPPEAYAAKAVLDSVPPAAVQQLQTFVKANPNSAQAAMQNFDKTFGNGTSKLILGGQ